MTRWPAAAVLGLALGCGTTEGPLLRARDAGAGAGAAGAPQTPPVAAPPSDTVVRPGMRMHYQISGGADLTASADVFVLDLFETSATQLAGLHAAGRRALAYVSAGSFEPWRPDADSFPDDALGEPLAGYPSERWLDHRSPELRMLMRERLSLARDKGFDGVMPAALSGYLATSGFALSADDQLDYDRFLTSAARELGLTPGLSDFALITQLADAFDWAIASGCLAADSCERLRPLLDRGKAVFDLETETDRTAQCARASELGVTPVFKRAGDSAWGRSCP